MSCLFTGIQADPIVLIEAFFTGSTRSGLSQKIFEETLRLEYLDVFESSGKPVFMQCQNANTLLFFKVKL